MPGQGVRAKSVKQKLSAVTTEFKNKSVLIVDDSIVRGTTSKQIVQMAREAGAKKVYMASAAPGVRYPNVYGIDMPSANELIAHGRTDQEVGKIIGADWIIYQDLEDLIASGTEGNKEIKRFECSVFNGEYITGDVDKSYLGRIEARRNDAAKEKGKTAAESKKQSVIGIHNNSHA